jgi:hypothetical protein
LSSALWATDPTRRTARMHYLFRRTFSFPAMLACLLAMLATLTVRSRFNDTDTWWQLKTGEIIWTTHTVPTTDLFSYTTNHHTWIPHEWLSQLLIYGAYRWGGYSGLMLWLCFFSAALLIAGYTLCSLYSGNSKTAFLGALIIWLFSTTVLSIRPQLVGYLLLVLELILVHLGRTRDPRWFFGLPPLFVLWVNCHGSFFLGLLLLGLFLFCSFFDLRLGLLVSSRWDLRRRRTLVWALLLSTAALFLNPVGVKQILYPLNTLLRQHIVVSQISEWMPLQFTDPRGAALLAILGCIFLLVIVRRAELFWHELLMLVMGTLLGISHQRLVVVFGLLAAPIVSRLISTSWDSYSIEHDHPLPNAVLITLALATVIFTFPSRQDLAEQVADGNPVKAVEFIKNRHLSGHMLNAFDYGGYLIWALPNQPVFVDGRADVYEWSGVLDEFARWATLQRDPNALLDKYDVDFCILERGSLMANVMPLLPTWKVIYSDDVAVIFVRSAK